MLGCSGSLPGPRSPASGYLVEADDAAGRTWRVLVDLGSGALGPLQRYADLRSLDAIHLATARQLGADLGRVVTYDDRMAAGAESLGLTIVAPS